MYSITGNSGQRAYGLKHFTVDKFSDLATISLRTVIPGSEAFIIETSETYMLNHQNEWVLIHKGGSSSGSGGDDEYEVIYDGGIENKGGDLTYGEN